MTLIKSAFAYRFLKLIKSGGKHFFQTIGLLLLTTVVNGQELEPCYLYRSLNDLTGDHQEISTEKAIYTSIFGDDPASTKLIKGVKRLGYLTIASEGETEQFNYEREETVYFVLKGEGLLNQDKKFRKLVKNDFFYVPANTEHSFSTTSENQLHILVMGYKIPEKTLIEPGVIQLANTGQVEFQSLEQLNHGATSKFQLLLGTTQSERDRLAVAYQVNSLFVIDFDPGGTNIPHRHENEEEIYLVLQGKGDMVAGLNAQNEPNRFSAKAGDVFFFSRNCLVGFYSSTLKGEPNARILAIRSKYP